MLAATFLQQLPDEVVRDMADGIVRRNPSLCCPHTLEEDLDWPNSVALDGTETGRLRIFVLRNQGRDKGIWPSDGKMGKIKPPTHAEHLSMAPIALHAQEAVHKLWTLISGRAPEAAKIWCELRKADTALRALRSELDSMYHAVTSDKEFVEDGQVYYRPRAGDL